jgi:hypothetical protein
MSGAIAFELGAVRVPMTAALGLQQQFAPIGGSTVQRLGNGAAIKQTAWSKLRVTLTCDGWVPPGLGGLNYDGPLLLKCGLPRSIASTATSVTLPSARRTDSGYLPFARAHLPGREAETPVSVTGNTATLTAVTGAQAYTVWYYPQLSVVCDMPTETFDGAGAAVSWELTAEEV